jgi:predicted secreted Zn-dependent protease
MRPHTSARLLLIVASACSHNPPAGTTPRPATEFARHTRTYPVNPLNSNDLAQAIRDERKQFTSQAIGMTHNELRWSYSRVPTASGQCALSSVQVHVESTISLPQWDAPAGTSGARLSWWRRIEGTVSQHELHHATIAEESGTDLAKTLQALTAPDCRTLADLAEQACRRELDHLRQRQVDFDMAEGVVEIPPPPP